MPRVFLYRDAVDFRKQSNGLAAIVELELGHNPFDGGLYVFTNRAHNKIKCLMWEDNGFVLYYKSLAEERFKRPKPITLNRMPTYAYSLPHWRSGCVRGN